MIRYIILSLSILLSLFPFSTPLSSTTLWVVLHAETGHVKARRLVFHHRSLSSIFFSLFLGRRTGVHRDFF